MAIDVVIFLDKFAILAERFNRKFSQPTLDQYYDSFSKLTTAEFVAAVNKLFVSAEFFPTPQQIIDQVEASSPVKTFQLEGYIRAYVDMNPEEQAAYRKAIDRARPKKAKPAVSEAGLTAIANVLGEIRSPVATLHTEIAQKRQWLSDPVLRMEAIEWAMRQEGVELVTDNEGFITDLNFVEQPVGAIA